MIFKDAILGGESYNHLDPYKNIMTTVLFIIYYMLRRDMTKIYEGCTKCSNLH